MKRGHVFPFLTHAISLWTYLSIPLMSNAERKYSLLSDSVVILMQIEAAPILAKKSETHT